MELNVRIADADFHGVHPAARQVARRTAAVWATNAWIGILTIVLEGIRICMGAGAALGAAAVGVNDVPDGALVAGNPVWVISFGQGGIVAAYG